MHPLTTYLLLRRRLGWRLLREIGWARLMILVPMLGLAVGRALLLAAPHPQAQWAVPVTVAALLASAHRQRADLRFLATSAPAFRRWLAVEYGLLSGPVALVLVAFGDWGAALLTLVLAPAVAALPPARESRSTQHRARSLFRSEAFEWVSGMRAGGLWAWPLLLAGAVWQHWSPLGPVVALVLWLLVLLACYGTPEPLTMLVLAGRTPRQFLRRRLLLGLGYAALTAAPFVWLLAAGPAGGGGAAAVALGWLGLVGLLILTKYAFYPNATHIRTTQALVVGVALLLPGNPVYPVLLLVAVGGVIWQSQRRLHRIIGEPSHHA
ncbi:hypothetical protein [Hymenobacter properus]|uniref:Uncharacterized protein n=1 Tax=Hymenobacter properus TaxID=2791026 RepID=A0A931BHI2_9BACT|nr:hypothetical protein [Hymenobacter properus]MBF9144035.1 hypothetical protein [Hymenobacter properus]MBR7722852.1 hypothetical protein [Microvirga sp. SRT04]